MKTFEEYQDGDWVVLKKLGHEWDLMSFQAYKSQWTYNAFRLKYGSREIIADISEIEPLSTVNSLVKERYENTDRDFQFGSKSRTTEEEDYSDFQD